MPESPTEAPSIVAGRRMSFQEKMKNVRVEYAINSIAANVSVAEALEGNAAPAEPPILDMFAPEITETISIRFASIKLTPIRNPTARCVR